jgi:hypothetical protein
LLCFQRNCGKKASCPSSLLVTNHLPSLEKCCMHVPVQVKISPIKRCNNLECLNKINKMMEDKERIRVVHNKQ